MHNRQALVLSRICPSICPSKQCVKGASDVSYIKSADVGIKFSGTGALVAEEFLDVAQVGAVLEEVSGEGMAQRVNAGCLTDFCAVEG